MGWSTFAYSNLEKAPYSRMYLSWDSQCWSWHCHMLNAFHFVQFGHTVPTVKKNLTQLDLHLKKHSMCFETLHLPQSIRYRSDRTKLPKKYWNINREMRSHLTADFESPQGNILLYSHQDSHRRRWVNAPHIQKKLAAEQGYENVILMQGFDGISTRRQCQLFYD